MLRALSTLLILVLTGGLTVAAIIFLPETLYFPEIEFSTPDKLVIRILQRGQLDKNSCDETINKLKGVIRIKCADCKYVQRCTRGLDEERKRVMSHEPIGIPSARIAGGTLTMTFAADNSQLALNVCRAVAQGTAGGKPGERMSCYAAGDFRR